VDRGHGVARALETVLLNVKGENKAQDMSLVVPLFSNKIDVSRIYYIVQEGLKTDYNQQ